MFTIDAYTPARVIFGAGRLKELGSVSLPGKKALICVTQDGLMEKLGIQKRVTELLKENGTEYVILTESSRIRRSRALWLRPRWPGKRIVILSSAWEAEAVWILQRQLPL